MTGVYRLLSTVYCVWQESGVQAGFTTRHFPLVLHRTDDLLNKKNHKKFIESLSRDQGGPLGRSYRKFVVLNQVHGSSVAVLTDGEQYSKEGFYSVPRCDAAMTDIPGLTLIVLTADCLSIFFRAGSWVALAHAGWRGSKKKIARKTLRLLLEKSGAKKKDVRIVLGPSIGVRHYEVGPEFKDHFPASSLRHTGNCLHFDLAKENKRQLMESGVPEKNITDTGLCTVAANKDFYSFRQEKEKAGRIISYITRWQ